MNYTTMATKSTIHLDLWLGKKLFLELMLYGYLTQMILKPCSGMKENIHKGGVI